MNTLNKAELVDVLYSELELDKKEAKLILECFFDLLIETLATGESVKLSGFGNFVVRQKAARPGRNPKTGDYALVKARRVVAFKAGLKLKRHVVQ